MLYQWSWFACLTSLCQASGENWGPFPQAQPVEISLMLSLYVHIGSSILCCQILPEQEIACKLLNVWCLLVCYVCWCHVSLFYDCCSVVFCASTLQVFFLLLQSTFIITVCNKLNFSCAPGILAPTCWFTPRFHPVLMGRANSFKIVRHYGLES